MTSRQRYYICKFENQCNKSFSREGSLYHHYIKKHDQNREFWPLYTIRPAKQNAIRGRPRQNQINNNNNQQQQPLLQLNNQLIDQNHSIQNHYQLIQQYIKTQIEYPDTEAINHLLIYLYEFNEYVQPTKKSSLTKSFIQEVNKEQIDPAQCLSPDFLLYSKDEAVSFLERIKNINGNFKQFRDQVCQDPLAIDADDIFVHFLVEASWNIKTEIYKEIAFLIQLFRIFCFEKCQVDFQRIKNIKSSQGNIIYQQLDDFKTYWKYLKVKNVTIRKKLDSFKLIGKDNYQKNIDNADFILEFLREFLEEYSYVSFNQIQQ